MVFNEYCHVQTNTNFPAQQSPRERHTIPWSLTGNIFGFKRWVLEDGCNNPFFVSGWKCFQQFSIFVEVEERHGLHQFVSFSIQGIIKHEYWRVLKISRWLWYQWCKTGFLSHIELSLSIGYSLRDNVKRNDKINPRSEPNKKMVLCTNWIA